MEKKSKLTSPSFDEYFPTELLTEVLINLPVKSLLKCRCVSKTWLRIIDNPNFISNHLIHYQNKMKNCDIHRFSIVELDKSGGICLKIHRIDTLRRRGKPIDMLDLAPCATSFDGLLLLSDPFSGDQLHLWNPSVRKAVPIPDPPFSSFECVDLHYALGFSSLSNDYKVLAFQVQDDVSTGLYSELEFAVYGLNDDCWRKSSKRIDGIKSPWCERRDAKYSTNGAAYWLMISGRKDYYTHVASFDFDDQEFSFVKIPKPGRKFVRSLFLLGESIAILGVSSVSTCIWVLNKDGGRCSWTKCFSRDSSIHLYNFFEDNEDDYTHRRVLFFEKSCEFFISSYGKLTWYDIRSNEMRHVFKSMNVYNVYLHVDSLMLCGGLRTQDLIPFP